MDKKIVTVEECKEIWEDYQKCKKQIEAYKNRIKMIEQLLTEAKAQLYYADIQLQKMKEIAE